MVQICEHELTSILGIDRSWLGEWRYKKQPATLRQPYPPRSMSQISRAGSLRTFNVGGCEVIDLDSDDDEDRPLHPYSQSSFASGSSFATTDIVDLCDSSDDEKLDPAYVLSQLSASASASRRTQSSTNVSSSWEDLDNQETSLFPLTKKRKNEDESGNTRKKRKTAEEVARDKGLKAVEREAMKQRKKDEKEAEREEAKAAKAREKLVQQAQKEAKKRYDEVNKVVTDKKATLVDCVVEVSSHIETHPVFGAWLQTFERKLRENSADFVYNSNKYNYPYIMQWWRRVDKEFNEELREWQPVDVPYHALEPIIALFYTAEDLIKKVRLHRDQVLEEIGHVKMMIDEEFMRLGSNVRVQRSSGDYQVFVIITEAKRYCEKNSKEDADALATFRIRANVQQRAHVVTCESRQDMAQKLQDISADMGIKPYKLIRRSHLPNVSDINVKCKSTFKETYKEMLMKVYKFTEPVANSVLTHKPTLNQLMESYNEIGDEGQRGLLFERVMVHRPNQAVPSSRSMNTSLSRRLHKVTFGLNPYAFVGPDTAMNMHH